MQNTEQEHKRQTMTMKLRLFTQWAADRMEETLIRKDMAGYVPWETRTHAQRYRKLLEEYQEVQEAFSACCLEEKRTPEAVAHLQLELIDVALTAMMMAGGFDENINKLKRGRRA